MIVATDEFIKELDALSDKRKQEIRSAPDLLDIKGTRYYVSLDGDDTNDGKSPLCAWKTLARVSEAEELQAGDGVLFRRGDIFRGFLRTRSGVSYGAFGVGEKPRLYGWDKDLSDTSLWELYDAEHSIWRLREPIPDCGTLVFDHGKQHCRKLIPSYIDSRFVCRDDESRAFDMAAEMTRDLDMVCFYEDRLTEAPSKGESFPIPIIDAQSFGELYLRCDGGNPAELYGSIEALPHRNMVQVGNNANVTVDNLCLKYIGCHAVSAGGKNVAGLRVTNCEIGWIGGSIQHYYGTDPNYPQGRRGTVTRFGNGVEVYGGCDDYEVSNCYVYQVYDAGITHQITTNGKKYEMKHIRYLNNLVEHCVYSIEYFLEKTGGDTESYIEDCLIKGNVLRFSGYGWGQQRHNTDTPAHIKGWSYENTARSYTVCDNIFDRAAYRMLHLVARERESCPEMYGNTYVQSLGLPLGQYGANGEAEPPIMTFDLDAEDKISDVMGERNAKLFLIDRTV